MSAYKSFAVVGAGAIGTFIIEDLLKAKSAGIISSVVVVSRYEKTAAENPIWTAKGAKFAVIDYESPATLEAAFIGIDVVISTVGRPVVNSQHTMAEAAKAASVKLFVPSEFGDIPAATTTGLVYEEKRGVLAKLKEIGLPSTVFYNGLFTDLIWGHIGWDFESGKILVGGEGKAPLSFTHREDISRFVVHVLTTLPASELEWRNFRIEGDRMSFNDVISRFQEKTGRKLDVTHIPRSILKEKLEKNPDDAGSLFLLSWDGGAGIVGEQTDNGVWPEWNPKKVFDFLA